MRRVMGVLVLSLALISSVGQAEARPAKMPMWQARTAAESWVTNLASKDSRIYKWGVGRCWRLSRLRVRCRPFWNRGVLKPRQCRTVLEFKSVSRTTYTGQRIRPRWCFPIRMY